MTKKDYIIIAGVINKAPSFAPSLRDARASFARSFADALVLENPAFDRVKFLAACGVEG